MTVYNALYIPTKLIKTKWVNLFLYYQAFKHRKKTLENVNFFSTDNRFLPHYNFMTLAYLFNQNITINVFIYYLVLDTVQICLISFVLFIYSVIYGLNF